MKENPSIAWFDDEPSPLPLAKGSNPFGEERVAEYVLGTNYVPVKREGNVILVKLFNTDPVNWNKFMFPFDQTKEKVAIDPDLDLLSEPNATASIRDRAKGKSDSSNRVLPLQFEIKHSQTSGKLTLYVFRYELTKYDREFGEVESAVVNVASSGNIASLPDRVASNVVPVLARLPSVVE